MSATTIAKKPYIIVSDHTTLGDINKLLESTPSDSCENLYGTQVKINGKYENILYISDKARAGIGLEQHRLFSTNFHLQRKKAYVLLSEVVDRLKETEQGDNTAIKRDFDYFSEVPRLCKEWIKRDANNKTENYVSARKAKGTPKPMEEPEGTQNTTLIASRTENMTYDLDVQSNFSDGESFVVDYRPINCSGHQPSTVSDYQPSTVPDYQPPLKIKEVQRIHGVLRNLPGFKEKLLSLPNDLKFSEGSNWRAENVAPDGDAADFPSRLIEKSGNGTSETIFKINRKHKMTDGGFGKVVLYESDSGAQKLVKIAKHENEKLLLKEAALGKLLHNPEMNTIGFDNYCYDEKGKLLLISEFAKNGDLNGFPEQLKGLKAPLKRAIILTLIKDISTGVMNLQEHGIVHQDLNKNNVVIDATGRFQIIDLGAAFKTNMFRPLPDSFDTPGMGYDKMIVSPYAAPEMLRIHDKSKDTTAWADYLRIYENIYLQYVDIFGLTYQLNPSSEIFQYYAERIHRLAWVEYERTKKTFGKIDVYGIGAVAYYALSGSQPYEKMSARSAAGQNGDIRKKKARLSEDKDSRGIRTGEEDASGLTASVGDKFMDEILTDLLVPYEGKRLTAQDIGNHEAMKYLQNGEESAVGSKEIRDLIIAIASGKQRAIDEKSRAFEAKFVPKERAQGNEITHA